MEDELKATIQELLKDAIQNELVIPRMSRAFDGTPKPVSRTFSSPLPAPRFSTGTLYNSTEVYFESDFEDGELNLVVDFGSADYWYWVDQGRQPSERYPNIQDIRNWVEQKPALNYPDLSIDQRTFLVARSIKEYGYYGINFIEKAYDKVNLQIEERLGELSQVYLQNLIERGIIVKWNTPGNQSSKKSFVLKLEII